MEVKNKLLLKIKDFKPSCKDWKIAGIFNPGGIRTKSKKILLMVRIAESPKKKKIPQKCPVIISESEYKNLKKEDGKLLIHHRGVQKVYLKDGKCHLPNISHFRRVILDKTGFKVEKIENIPYFSGIPKESEYGVEDPRITNIRNKYYMTYVTVSHSGGISTSLATSKNLKNWKRRGIIFQEQNKDVVLFPEKINGKFVALNRPESAIGLSKSGIWISYSPDLIHWGEEKSILKPRRDSWECSRNGAGAPPIKTKKGWLLIYHGVDLRKKKVYSGGAALLDLKDPSKILARTPKDEPLLTPSLKYQRVGFMQNVIFPTAAIPDLDGESLLIFSGGADSVVSVTKISFENIFLSLQKLKPITKNNEK